MRHKISLLSLLLLLWLSFGCSAEVEHLADPVKSEDSLLFMHSTGINTFISVFHPILYGALIAYLLCPGVKFFERRVFRAMNRRKLYGLSRACSVIVVFLLAIS
mgnify:CR=1 FL=1